MIKRILISTDSQLHGIFNNNIPILMKLKKSNISLLNDNNVVYFNGEKFDITSIASSIIIVKDSSTIPLTDVNSETDFLLHHSRTENHQKEVVEKFTGRKKRGMHSNRDEDLYKPVFEKLFDDTISDKLKAILEVLGFTDKEIEEKETLESQLNFLHHCLTPDGLSKEEVTNAEWAKLDEFTKLKTANDGPFGNNYLSALSTLRDALLS